MYKPETSVAFEFDDLGNLRVQLISVAGASAACFKVRLGCESATFRACLVGFCTL